MISAPFLAFEGESNSTISGASSSGRFRLEGYVNNIVKQPITGLLISQTGGTVAFLPRPTTYGVRGSLRF